jgi:Uma2 family endonuclease
MTPTAPTTGYYEIVSQLPPATDITFHHVSWEDYEELLDQVGEASGLRISFNEGTLQVMSLSPEHEKYARFFEKITTATSLRLRLKILSFGSATMKKSRRLKGKEPDACFYVQSADALGAKIQLDFETDPPPDIAVEVDVHHTSHDTFSIYAGLGVPEIWHYDGSTLTIYQLQDGAYTEVTTSPALPMFTNQILTEFLNRLRAEDEFQTLLAFDEWLQSLPK